MNTVRLNITLPVTEKKSYIIASDLDMYFDYIDLKEAEKRLESNEPTLTLDEMKKELRVPIDKFK